MVITSSKLKDTANLAGLVAENLRGGDILLLDGELGAGKTAFTKALAAALGVKDVVTSPTFTFMKTYQGNCVELHHFDMYRAETADELYELGLEEYFGRGVCVVEWNKFSDFPRKPYTIKITCNTKGKRFFEVPDELLDSEGKGVKNENFID